MAGVGTCLISHWPFNSQSSLGIFDQNKHGLWDLKGQRERVEKRGRIREEERERWRERRERHTHRRVEKKINHCYFPF